MKKNLRSLTPDEAFQILDDPLIKEDTLLRLLDANISEEVNKAIIMDERVNAFHILNVPDYSKATDIQKRIFENKAYKDMLQDKLVSGKFSNYDIACLENTPDVKNAVLKLAAGTELSAEEKQELESKNLLTSCESIAKNDEVLGQMGIKREDLSKAVEVAASNDETKIDDQMSVLYENYLSDINKDIVMNKNIPISEFFKDENHLKITGADAETVYDTLAERIKTDGLTKDDISNISKGSFILVSLMQDYTDQIKRHDPKLEDTLQTMENLHLTNCVKELLNNEELRKEIGIGKMSKAEREGVSDPEIEDIKKDAEDLFNDAKSEYHDLAVLRAEINRHMENVCKELDTIGGLDVQVQSYRENIKRGFEKDIQEIDTKVAKLDKKYAEELKAELEEVDKAQDKLDKGEKVDIAGMNLPVLKGLYEAQAEQSTISENSKKPDDILEELKAVGKKHCKDKNLEFNIAGKVKDIALAAIQKAKDITANIGKFMSKEKAKDDLEDQKIKLEKVKGTRETLQQFRHDALKDVRIGIKENIHKRIDAIKRFKDTKIAMITVKPLQREKEANLQDIANKQQRIARDQAKIKAIYEKAFNRAERISNRWNKVRKFFGVKEAAFDRSQTYLLPKDAAKIKALELKCIQNHKDILEINKENNQISKKQLEVLRKHGLEDLNIDKYKKETFDINSPECEELKKQKVVFSKPLTAQQIDVLNSGLSMGASPKLVSEIAKRNMTPDMEVAALSAIAAGIQLTTFDKMVNNRLSADQIVNNIDNALSKQAEAIQNNEFLEDKYKQAMSKASSKDLEQFYEDEKAKEKEQTPDKEMTSIQKEAPEAAEVSRTSQDTKTPEKTEYTAERKSKQSRQNSNDPSFKYSAEKDRVYESTLNKLKAIPGVEIKEFTGKDRNGEPVQKYEFSTRSPEAAINVTDELKSHKIYMEIDVNPAGRAAFRKFKAEQSINEKGDSEATKSYTFTPKYSVKDQSEIESKVEQLSALTDGLKDNKDINIVYGSTADGKKFVKSINANTQEAAQVLTKTFRENWVDYDLNENIPAQEKTKDNVVNTDNIDKADQKSTRSRSDDEFER